MPAPYNHLSFTPINQPGDAFAAEQVFAADHGTPDHRTAVRTLVALIREMLEYEADAFDADEEVDGADLLERFAEWRPQLREAIYAEIDARRAEEDQ